VNASVTAVADVAQGYKVELDVFEGPLDLLLHLVKKHELDIFDIPISFVTQKYLEYLDLMSALSLDVAGEYLLMAATLAHIKSRELLPPTPGQAAADEDEDGNAIEDALDPRAELIRRLLEYQKYKQAADQLGDRPVVGRNVWTRGLPQEDAVAEDVEQDAMPPLAEFPVIKLIEALDRILAAAKVKVSHEVSIDRLSVAQCIQRLTDRLEAEGSFGFRTCFGFLSTPMTEAAIRHEAVVTFLSILEMAKLGMLKLSQPDADVGLDEDIIISRAGDDAALRERAAAAAQELEDDFR
jgi:segregation and condensation protein A